MIAIFKREIRNYLKRPLFWVGVLLVIYGVFNATSPYLTTHYLTTGHRWSQQRVKAVVAQNLP